MEFENFYYLLINLASISIPFLYSFTDHSQFYKRWKALWPSIILTGIFFIIWDIIFTRIGIWGFNPKYLIGLDLFGLPIEEWLFFITIPYACVFTYDILVLYVREGFLQRTANYLAAVIAVSLIVLAVLQWEKMYTFTTFIMTAIFLIILLRLKVNFLGRYFIVYLIIFAFPFLIVNGLLTGMSTSEPIVWYNNAEND